ncbi:MAG: hypothetical protein U9O94_06905 [Nanoarchaeota archaeon]|nr:hypothetical protein [Nanoarchaeota archaeon]
MGENKKNYSQRRVKGAIYQTLWNSDRVQNRNKFPAKKESRIQALNISELEILAGLRNFETSLSSTENYHGASNPEDILVLGRSILNYGTVEQKETYTNLVILAQGTGYFDRATFKDQQEAYRIDGDTIMDKLNLERKIEELRSNVIPLTNKEGTIDR